MSDKRTPAGRARQKQATAARAAAYSRALRRLARLHRKQFEQLYLEERARHQKIDTDDDAAAR